MPSRRFFSVFNRTVNPPIRLLLTSPAHRLASGRLALITVTGRRTGRRFTIPTGYRREGDRVTIEVGWPESKLWWRNLNGAGAPVELAIAGERFRGHAVAVGDETAGVTVEVEGLEGNGAMNVFASRRTPARRRWIAARTVARATRCVSPGCPP